jgi:hypothetical protein
VALVHGEPPAQQALEQRLATRGVAAVRAVQGERLEL